MDGIMRYRRKPAPAREEEVIAAKYEPGRPLNALAEVAWQYDADAELAEAVLPSGPVLLIRYTNMEGDRPFATHELVEPGGYLACGGVLHVTDEAGLRQWYDLIGD